MLNPFGIKKYFQRFTLLVSAIIILISSIYLLFAYKTLNNLAEQVLSIISNQGVASVEASIENEIYKTEYIANSKAIRNIGNSYEEMFDTIEKLTSYNSEDIFVIINEDGLATNMDGHHMDVSSYEFFQKAINGVSNISDPIRMPDGRWVCFVTVPYYDLNGDISGCFGTIFPSENLNDIVENVSLFQEGSAFIINSEGKIVAGSGDDVTNSTTSATVDVSNGTLPPGYESFSVFLNEVLIEQNGYSSYDLNGEKNIAVFQTIEGTDWIFISSMPKSLIYSGIYKVLLLIFFGIVIVGILMVILYVYSKKLKKNLDEEKDKFLSAVNIANLLTIELSKDGTISSINENFLEITGYEKDEVINKKLTEFINLDYSTIYMDALVKMLHGEKCDAFEISIYKKNGEHLYLVCNSLHNKDKASEDIIYVACTDVTNIKEYQNNMHKLAYYDTLTDLKNRFSLEEHTKQLIEVDVEFAIIYIDLDNFKFINDSFGHKIGDNFLVTISERIVSLKCENIEVFRVSGDEIVVVYSNFKEYSHVGKLAEKILMAVGNDYFINDIKINTSCSIGISRYPHDSGTSEEIFKSAEIAMNRAKDNGKAQIIFYQSSMDIDLINSILLENDLRDAVKNNDFTLYYQPQYYIDSGELYGFEALIRWTKHPVRGFVSPVEFIPIAEKTQLIIPIGEWVIREASEFAKRLNKEKPCSIPVSVNISSVQLLNEDFVSSVLGVFESTKVKYNCIKFELTESVAMESIDKNLLKINALNTKGVKFALDDFGTGYSSLTYLKKLPIQLLKIDKSFIDSILDEDDQNKEILSSIISLSHSLDIQVVAEGVEEKKQLEWLSKKGCNIVQGYYSGKPVSEEDAVKLVDTNIYILKNFD